ncbi:hypothetical protein B296_00047582, partial [Ensete ventricosum]
MLHRVVAATIGLEDREPEGCRERLGLSDFVIGLAPGSRKLRGLQRPEAVVALHRAGFPGLGPLVTPFAGVPPGEPIGEGNPGSIIILQKWLGVGTATVASSVGRGCSGIGRNLGVRLGKSAAGVVERRSEGGST